MKNFVGSNSSLTNSIESINMLTRGAIFKGTKIPSDQLLFLLDPTVFLGQF